MFLISKAADLNLLVQGGQWYCAFPFSKDSLIKQLTSWGGVIFNCNRGRKIRIKGGGGIHNSLDPFHAYDAILIPKVPAPVAKVKEPFST
jgi:hypothetical protein